MDSHCLIVRPRFVLALTIIFCNFVEQGFQTAEEIALCPMEETHCGPLSCQDRIVTPLGFVVNRPPCRCDRMCVVYGDCCIDYFDHCVNDTHFPIASNYSDFFECITPFREVPISYVVVARCPPSWPQDSVRQYCENTTLAQSQTLLTIPVDGPDDITFKNVYCSVCHQVPANRVESWKVIVLCDLYDEAGMITLNEQLCNGERSLEQPSSSVVRRCYSNMVDACPPTAPPSQAALCENHTAIMHSTDGNSFKNVYCADCNNSPRDTWVCRFRLNYLLDVAFSFSLLFDFTVNKVSISEEEWQIPVGPAQNLGTCNTWQIYDPFQNRCRILRCPVNTILQGDLCVDYPTNRGVSDSSFTYQTRTGDCPQQILFRDFVLNHLEVNLTKLDFSIERTLSKQYTEISVRADFSIADDVEDVMERFIYNETLFHAATTVQCNMTAFTLISASKSAIDPSGSPVCDGFVIQDVALTDVTDGVFGMNGYTYDRLEFMHVTVYEFANENVKKVTSVRLCSPFLNKRCPVLSLNRSEFTVLGSIRGPVFHHIASGMSIPDKDMWHLPDDSVRVCDFLSNVSSSAALPAWLTTLSDLSVTSGACSLFFLVQTFITYLVFPALRNQPGQIVMNLMAALILAQSVLMTGGISVSWLCTLRATVLHFAWLAVFLWMSVMAWDISYRMKLNRVISIRDEPMHGHKVLKLGMFAWGFPALFVAVNYLMARLSQDKSWSWIEYGGRYCWIQDPLHSLLAFGVPVAVIILINCALLVFMIYKVIVNRKRLVAAQIAGNVKTELILCSKIIVLTGMTWTLFLAANLLDIVAIWYISVVANSLQGALIGIIFLWRENVRSLWRQKLFGRGGNSRSTPSEETA